MKKKYLVLVTLVSLLNGIGVHANAAERNVTHVIAESPTISDVLSLSASTINDIKARKTFEFSTPKGSFISLGETFFSKLENRGITLNSGLGDCVTDSRGCWSTSYGAYLPVLVDKNKLAAYQALHASALNVHVSGASAGNILIGIAGLVSAVAAGVVLVVAAPALSVVGVATTVGLFAAFIGGSITACQYLAGRCK